MDKTAILYTDDDRYYDYNFSTVKILTEYYDLYEVEFYDGRVVFVTGAELF